MSFRMIFVLADWIKDSDPSLIHSLQSICKNISLLKYKEISQQHKFYFNGTNMNVKMLVGYGMDEIIKIHGTYLKY